MPLPMPLLAPVTTATLPVKSIIGKTPYCGVTEFLAAIMGTCNPLIKPLMNVFLTKLTIDEFRSELF